MRQRVIIKDLGMIGYEEAVNVQNELQAQLIKNKRSPHPDPFPSHHLLFCEHPPVYTIGKSGKPEHLLYNENELEEKGIAFHKTSRGGDITFHGPGQCVVYPIFDLDYFFRDVHRFVRFLEEAVIRTLADFSVVGGRKKGFTGVWIDATSTGMPDRKICAIGVHLSRWVSKHGLALNVNSDLSYFTGIIPCGIQDDNKTVTSLRKELGLKEVDFELVKNRLQFHFSEIFAFESILSLA